ncbi:MAG: hypothetical protein M1824_002127 [Vezdaea acicularis]|nr:MAG: hypothetical protein M1824_002127 [Vezdaea acicularis]
MSLLQNEDFTIYRLRTSYLSSIKDGVGERLITVNPAVLNTSGFRAAGWTPNPADTRRTYSPPIPTAIASEYFQAPPRSAGLPQNGLGEEDDEGGLVTGARGSEDTVGPGLNATRRRRRREQMEEEDSSDLSDESDDDGDGGFRAAQQIRFAKMPVRTRSGSSPIRSSNTRDGPSVLVTSPSRPPGSNRLRRGSLGAVEAVKERARRDTTTSSEMSSENDLDPSVFKRKQIQPANPAKASRTLAEGLQGNDLERRETKDSTDLEGEEDSGEDSDGTALSSEFEEAADSVSLMDSVANPLISSPLSIMDMASTEADGKRIPKSKAAPQILQALPPPRPISTIMPVSLLSQAIKAKRSNAASPFEGFATLSGKGDPNPLSLRIFSAQNPSKPFEVLIRRTTEDKDSGMQRTITVADAIGLSLWRYCEEGVQPPIAPERMNVNWWTLRMVEDGEVEEDFPALERTKPIVSFASNNTRGGRNRSANKPFDEFALVEATSSQFAENERLTPNFKHEAPAATTPSSPEEENTPSTVHPPSIPFPLAPRQPRRNPILGPEFSTAYSSHLPPADQPTAPTSTSTPRTGVSKILRIHLHSADPFASQVIAVDVTTDTYMAEVLTNVCQKRNLAAAAHVFKLSNTNIIVPLDRTVESLRSRADLDLLPRRFATDGVTSASPASSSPNAPILADDPDPARPHRPSATTKLKKGGSAAAHPLAATTPTDPLGLLIPRAAGTSKRWVVWRKQPMSFMPTHERVLAIDGELLLLLPSDTSAAAAANTQPENRHHPLAGLGAQREQKTTTIHFGNVVGAKMAKGRKGSAFKVVVFREGGTKRYDFEAVGGREEARRIVEEVRRGIEMYKGAAG